MKVTNQKAQKIEGLWIDQCLLQNQQNNKQNTAQFSNNHLKDDKLDDNSQAMIKNFTLEIPFAERFKGKLFTFNKAGIIQKLDYLQPNSLKASLVFNRIKLRRNSCVKQMLRNRKNFVQINKAKISSRQSIQTKNTHRQTNSLDVSKVSTVSGRNRVRYASEYSEIKQQQIEETIIKNPAEKRKIYTSLKAKNNKKQSVRKQLQYETLTSNSQVIQSPKRFVKRFFTNADPQNGQSQSVSLTPNFISLDSSRNVQNNQNQIHQFPKLKLNPKQYRMSKRHMTKPWGQSQINKEKALPKIHFPRQKIIQSVQKQRLLTIR